MKNQSIQRAALPPIWLLIMISGLPLLSETVYTPSLPDIAHALKVSDALVEYTLSIYLWGFAIGVLFWGKISDQFGRKPCLTIGFLIYLLGCIGCYISPAITPFMFSRFIQAFGGSVGSVLSQAVTRDSFQGTNLSKVYASVGAALSIFPAIGPIIGGGIAEHLHWSYIFLFLIFCSFWISLMIFLYMPETHDVKNRQSHPIMSIAKQLLLDKKVLIYLCLIGGCNGIVFSYLAEGSFVLIDLLGFTPSQYGMSFILIAMGGLLGGIIAKFIPEKAIDWGLKVVLTGSFLSIMSILWHPIFFTIVAQITMGVGICMVTTIALSKALVDYKWCIGTASSLFGFFYYTITTMISFGMGWLHNGTLYPMPLYFLSIGLGMMFIFKKSSWLSR